MYTVKPMFSSSSGNSIFVKYNDTEVLVDVGVCYKNICLALKKLGTDIENIKAIFLTHEHSDHIRGLDVLVKHINVPIYINENSFDALPQALKENANFVIKNHVESVRADGIEAKIFATPHDSKGSVAYRFCFDNGKSVGIATDIGYISENVKNALFGCECVVFESNHDEKMLKDGPYPYILKKRILSDKGHLSNACCASFLPTLVKNGTKKIILAHLSGENNTPKTAYSQSAQSLANEGYTPEDVKLTVAMKSILLGADEC